MSIAESPRAEDGWDGLSASLGVLSATASARQDVLSGLPTGLLAAVPPGAATPQQQQQPLTAGEMEQLSSRFGGFVLDSSGNGHSAAASGGPDPASDPFAAASHLVSSVRGSSGASELQGFRRSGCCWCAFRGALPHCHWSFQHACPLPHVAMRRQLRLSGGHS